MVGWRAWALRWPQRASGGTQKMFSARYSSGSSGSAPWSCSATRRVWPLLEGIGDVLEEDQPEDDMLVFGGVHGAAQGVGHLPELGPRSPSWHHRPAAPPPPLAFSSIVPAPCAASLAPALPHIAAGRPYPGPIGSRPPAEQRQYHVSVPALNAMWWMDRRFERTDGTTCHDVREFVDRHARAKVPYRCSPRAASQPKSVA